MLLANAKSSRLRPSQKVEAKADVTRPWPWGLNISAINTNVYTLGNVRKVECRSSCIIFKVKLEMVIKIPRLGKGGILFWVAWYISSGVNQCIKWLTVASMVLQWLSTTNPNPKSFGFSLLHKQSAIVLNCHQKSICSKWHQGAVQLLSD